MDKKENSSTQTEGLDKIDGSTPSITQTKEKMNIKSILILVFSVASILVLLYIIFRPILNKWLVSFVSGAGILFFVILQIFSIQNPEIFKIDNNVLTNVVTADYYYVEIPDGVVEIASKPFISGGMSGDSHIVSVDIPDTVTTIGDYFLINCLSIREVLIPESVTEIGKSFLNSTKLDTLIYVKENSYAHIYCVEMGYNYQFYTDENKPILGNNNPHTTDPAFYIHRDTLIGYHQENAFNSTVTVPEGVTTIGLFAFRIPQEHTTEVFDEDTSTFEKVVYTLITPSNKIDEIILPNTVTTIKEKAFTSCEGVKSIYIPASVTEIEDDLFYSFQFEKNEYEEFLSNLTIYVEENSYAHTFFDALGYNFKFYIYE